MIWFSLNYGSIDNVLSQLLTVSGLDMHLQFAMVFIF